MQKGSNILISAYACEPDKGSEPGLGWNWVMVLHNQGYNLTVVTRSNNKSSIDKAIFHNPKLSTIDFIYYDLPTIPLYFKKFYGVYLYYEFWQLGVLGYIKKFVDVSKYALVHHLTFGVFRQPSHLYKLGRPFVMGPVGGAEKAPYELIKSFSFSYRLKEFNKKIIDAIFLLRPSVKECFNRAFVIFTRTEDTKNALPKYLHKRVNVVVDIGIHESEINLSPKLFLSEKRIEVLFVGRLLYWKGIEIAIKAFYKFNLQYPNSVFTIVGQGSYKSELTRLVNALKLGGKVRFTGSIPHSQVADKYNNADIFLFPSLHDAGPNVILEAAKTGLPIVALNLGGVGQILSSKYPGVVNSRFFHLDETIDSLSNLLCRLSSEQSFYKVCSQASLDVANRYTWEGTVLNTYNLINNSI
ncbi:glycosyltransferase family 4 protein [Spirosoma pulveris]